MKRRCVQIHEADIMIDDCLGDNRELYSNSELEKDV